MTILHLLFGAWLFWAISYIMFQTPEYRVIPIKSPLYHISKVEVSTVGKSFGHTLLKIVSFSSTSQRGRLPARCYRWDNDSESRVACYADESGYWTEQTKDTRKYYNG